MKIDYISDIHIEHYADTVTEIRNFVDVLVPHDRGEVLCVAGDISNRNNLSTEVLHALGQKYDHVVAVLGNHDHWVFQKNATTDGRVAEFKDMVSGLASNVTVLDGNVIEINGVTFGGASGWNDLKRAPLYGYTVDEMEKLWRSGWVDARYTKPAKSAGDWSCIEFAKPKIAQVENLSGKCDILITHFMPNIEECIADKWRYDYQTSYFVFDLPAGFVLPKVWVTGHSHEALDRNVNNCRFVRNPYGYPTERTYRSTMQFEI